jgi:hypothetical protein
MFACDSGQYSPRQRALLGAASGCSFGDGMTTRPFCVLTFGVVADRDVRIPTSLGGDLLSQSRQQAEEDRQVRVPAEDA